MRKKIIAVAAAASMLAASPVMAAVGRTESAGSSVAGGIIGGFGNFGGSEGFNVSRAFDEPTEISVNASASVSAIPDKASARFSVTEEADDAEEAVRKCSEKADEIAAALIKEGVDEDDLKTASTYASPIYDYGLDNPEKRIIAGYEASISVSVEGQDVDEIGKMISAAVKAGANGVDSLEFYCSDYDEKYAQALEAAVEAAEEKAETIADAGDLSIVRMKSASEGWQDVSARYSQNKSMGADMDSFMNSAEESWSMSVNPGTTEIQASVSAVFEAE